jgi:SAM-dependent methyltransferase
MIETPKEKTYCDFCNSNSSDILVSQKDIIHRCAPPDREFYLRKCCDCGLIYLDRGQNEDLKCFYPKDYEFYSDHSFYLYKLRYIISQVVSTPYLNLLFALLPFSGQVFHKLLQPKKKDYVKMIKPGRFLDIGCGSGINTHFFGYGSSIYSLKKRGFEVIGVEPSPEAAKVTRKYGLKVVPSIFEVQEQDFDCIRMNWSLEHVASPAEYFKTFKKLLKKGGKLIIAVPNYDGILYRLFPDCVEVPVHTYYFTPKTLEAYFKKYDFKIIDRYSFSYPGMFILASNALKQGNSIRLTSMETIFFQSFLNKFDAQMLGNDMVYLAEKA